MTLKAIVNALTSKKERIYLKHNYRFMLVDKNEVSSTSESISECYQTDFEISVFKLGQNLFKDLRKKNQNHEAMQMGKNNVTNLDISNGHFILNKSGTNFLDEL